MTEEETIMIEEEINKLREQLKISNDALLKICTMAVSQEEAWTMAEIASTALREVFEE